MSYKLRRDVAARSYLVNKVYLAISLSPYVTNLTNLREIILNAERHGHLNGAKPNCNRPRRCRIRLPAEAQTVPGSLRRKRFRQHHD